MYNKIKQHIKLCINRTERGHFERERILMTSGLPHGCFCCCCWFEVKGMRNFGALLSFGGKGICFITQLNCQHDYDE